MPSFPHHNNMMKTVWLPDSTKRISFWRCLRTGGSHGIWQNQGPKISGLCLKMGYPKFDDVLFLLIMTYVYFMCFFPLVMYNVVRQSHLWSFMYCWIGMIDTSDIVLAEPQFEAGRSVVKSSNGELGLPLTTLVI